MWRSRQCKIWCQFNIAHHLVFQSDKDINESIDGEGDFVLWSEGLKFDFRNQEVELPPIVNCSLLFYKQTQQSDCKVYVFVGATCCLRPTLNKSSSRKVDLMR
jgi:hypothetical protein